MEALYSVKPEKYKAQLKEMKENFDMLNNRRSTVREKSLEAVKAIEDERNKKEARSIREDRTMTGSQGGGGGGYKQFKQPVGPQPGQRSQFVRSLGSFHKSLPLYSRKTGKQT